MRYYKVLPITAALVLAACGGSNDAAADGKVTADEVAAAASEMVKPQPGKYDVKLEVVEFDVPGMDDATKQQMRQVMSSASAQTTSFCLTPEMAEKGPRAMLDGSSDMPCDFSKFEVNGGKLAAEGTCKAQGVDAKVLMTGETTATSSTYRQVTEQTLPTGQKANVTLNITSTRSGECV